MTSEERRQQLHRLIDGHTETVSAWRKTMNDLAETTRTHDGTLALIRQPVKEAFWRQSATIRQMVDANVQVIDASLATMKAALALLDDAAGVQ